MDFAATSLQFLKGSQPSETDEARLALLARLKAEFPGLYVASSKSTSWPSVPQIIAQTERRVLAEEPVPAGNMLASLSSLMATSASRAAATSTTATSSI